jgi:hypothetical protein
MKMVQVITTHLWGVSNENAQQKLWESKTLFFDKSVCFIQIMVIPSTPVQGVPAVGSWLSSEGTKMQPLELSLLLNPTVIPTSSEVGVSVW